MVATDVLNADEGGYVGLQRTKAQGQIKNDSRYDDEEEGGEERESSADLIGES